MGLFPNKSERIDIPGKVPSAESVIACKSLVSVFLALLYNALTFIFLNV